MGDHPAYTIHKGHHHFGWDNANTPCQTIAPGEAIEFEVFEASGGQLNPESTAGDVNNFVFEKINPVTGPIAIEGAEPGDAVKVTFLSFQPSGWGWTANIPGFGLLAEDFTEATLHHWSYDPVAMAPAMYGSIGKVPLKPFTGTIGLAPAAAGQHSIVPPRQVGGNMDIRDLTTGCDLYLPVEVPSALFSVGDTHAAQGDGEVCGTAIESPMRVALQFDLVKEAGLSAPRFTTPGPVTRHLDEKGYEVTTGVAPDLMEATKAATRYMIEELTDRHGMSAVDAYFLCSVAGDLRISEIVDAPNWIVSMYFPRLVLE